MGVEAWWSETTTERCSYRRKWGVFLLLTGVLASLTARWTVTRPLRLPADAASAAAAELRGCTSLECLQRVHAMPGRRQFEFPHFLVIGWDKCGTTSLYEHLVRQPQVLPPSIKEPHFFATYSHRRRKALAREPAYVRELLGAANASADTWRHAVFEASTSYACLGARVAPAVRAALPWVRLVASLREPISRAISLNGQRQDAIPVWGAEKNLTGQVCVGTDADIVPCVASTLQRRNYSVGLAEWLRAFPAQQLFIVQFEQLTGDGQAGVLRDLHAFLGLDPPVTALPHRNNRKKRKPKGWQLRREQYEQLVDLARRDAHEVVELLSKAGLADGAAWLAEWERVWKANLESCDAAGQCHIHVT